MADHPHSDTEPSRKRAKRSNIACARCHTLKVRCSGGSPCERCQNARKGSQCEYPIRERRLNVSESYLNNLRNGGGSSDMPERAIDSSTINEDETPRSLPSRDPSRAPPTDCDIINPLHETPHLFQQDQASQQQHFVGESTCMAFSDRILQCLNTQSTTQPLSEDRHVQNPAFTRRLNSSACKLPERIRANLLVRVALRFIGQDYHFFLHQDFLRQLEKTYSYKNDAQQDPIWTCKFFAVLALGELYSPSVPANGQRRVHSVPGTEYFLTAVSLLQDLFEEPSIAQVETMLLFCFYSNALGRVKSAHMYSGIALRLSTCLGLHRSLPEDSKLSPIDREHRVRLWWTVYIFDRSTSSRLGQPLTIDDVDIDVGLPSSDSLPSDAQEKLASPANLIAHVNISRITGLIMRDIYGPSSRANSGSFVQNVRTILQKLKNWDAHVPNSLRWNHGAPRSVASLQLHFNQCIILTTRPILLYVLKVKNPFSASSSGTSTPTISDTTRTLADSCISAARTSNAILSQLFVENSLATCGYFDAHHLFGSTLVLIVSAVIAPNANDSDAVQTAFQLLAVMRDHGNMTAANYYNRLMQIHWTIGRLFVRATVTEDATPYNESSENTTAPEPLPMGFADADGFEWSNLVIPNCDDATFADFGLGNASVDPLDNPLLQAFLDHTDGSLENEMGLSLEETEFVI